jgi:hypothetical protein
MKHKTLTRVSKETIDEVADIAIGFLERNIKRPLDFYRVRGYYLIND